MQEPKLKVLTTQGWWKNLAYVVGIAGVTTLISFPALAVLYPRYALFQPRAIVGYPYRSLSSNIADTLEKDSKYQNFVDALKEAGLFATLKQKERFTVFVPSDKAFNALPDDVFERLNQPENRVKVLKYHLVAGEITSKDIDSGEIVTVEGNRVQIVDNSNTNGTVKLNNANAKHPSIEASNGVIIEIDQVLLPPDF